MNCPYKLLRGRKPKLWAMAEHRPYGKEDNKKYHPKVALRKAI